MSAIRHTNGNLTTRLGRAVQEYGEGAFWGNDPHSGPMPVARLNTTIANILAQAPDTSIFDIEEDYADPAVRTIIANGLEYVYDGVNHAKRLILFGGSGGVPRRTQYDQPAALAHNEACHAAFGEHIDGYAFPGYIGSQNETASEAIARIRFLCNECVRLSALGAPVEAWPTITHRYTGGNPEDGQLLTDAQWSGCNCAAFYNGNGTWWWPGTNDPTYNAALAHHQVALDVWGTSALAEWQTAESVA